MNPTLANSARVSLVSAPSALGIHNFIVCPDLYVGSKGSNLVPHASTASTLRVELSSPDTQQFLKSIFLVKYCHQGRGEAVGLRKG